MIRIVLGNVGSGKTAMVVREMMTSDIPIHSNIITRKIKKNTVITKDQIFKEEVKSIKKDGTEVKDFKLNEDYWKKLRQKKGTISVILDEAHTLMNPRRAMSKKSIVMNDFIALLRRILGSSDSGYGELVLITQLERRLDVIAREMATKVQYCIGHYNVFCHKCGHLINETNETPNKMRLCPLCGKSTIRKNFRVEVFSFQNIDTYHLWEATDRKKKVHFEHYFIIDIEKVFPNYDTLQWENLLSD